VTLIQRFGSAANLNIHLHCLVLDGVYRTTGDAPKFYPVRAPTIAELQAVLVRLIRRLLRLLIRLGYLFEEKGTVYLASPEADPALGPLPAASCTYRIALGPRAGQKVVRLSSATALPLPPGTPTRCVELEGFSLHADTRCAIHQRHQLEQLCRYITRPAIANERLSVNEAGQIVLKLKTPYRDGTTQIAMEPLAFMQRLAALVPRPRLHLIRFHGVLAPNAKLRSAIVPRAASDTAPGTPDPTATLQPAAPAHIRWARLLQRVFDIDLEHCPNCGGALSVVAAILEQTAITKILTHRGLPIRAPPRAPARRDNLFEAA
jgi:hypothetical protein